MLSVQKGMNSKAKEGEKRGVVKGEGEGKGGEGKRWNGEG